MQVNVSHLSVDECARVLRINKHTLYRAVRRDEIPHEWIGNMVKIPVTFLGFTPPEPVAPRGSDLSNVAQIGGNRYGDQLDLFWMSPVRVWRNTGKPISRWWFEEHARSVTGSPEQGPGATFTLPVGDSLAEALKSRRKAILANRD